MRPVRISGSSVQGRVEHEVELAGDEGGARLAVLAVGDVLHLDPRASAEHLRGEVEDGAGAGGGVV